MTSNRHCHTLSFEQHKIAGHKKMRCTSKHKVSLEKFFSVLIIFQRPSLNFQMFVAFVFVCVGFEQWTFAAKGKSQTQGFPQHIAAQELMRARRENPKIRQRNTLPRKTYRHRIQQIRKTEEWKENKFHRLYEKIAKLKKAKVLAQYAQVKSAPGKQVVIGLGKIDVWLVDRAAIELDIFLGPRMQLLAFLPGTKTHYVDLLTYTRKKWLDSSLHHKAFRYSTIKSQIDNTYKDLGLGNFTTAIADIYMGEEKYLFEDIENFNDDVLNVLVTESKTLNAAKELQRARKKDPRARMRDTPERMIYKQQLARVWNSKHVVEQRMNWIKTKVSEMEEFKEIWDYFDVTNPKLEQFEINIPKEEIQRLLPENEESLTNLQLRSYNTWYLHKDGSLHIRNRTPPSGEKRYIESVAFYKIVENIRKLDAIGVLQSAIIRRHQKEIDGEP